MLLSLLVRWIIKWFYSLRLNVQVIYWAICKKGDFSITFVVKAFVEIVKRKKIQLSSFAVCKVYIFYNFFQKIQPIYREKIYFFNIYIAHEKDKELPKKMHKTKEQKFFDFVKKLNTFSYIQHPSSVKLFEC